jgi:hypothetical protein
MGDTGMAIFCNDVDAVIQIVSVVSNGEKNYFLYNETACLWHF